MIPFKILRNLGNGARKHPWRRRPVHTLTRLAARWSGGGLVFAGETKILERLRTELRLRARGTMESYMAELRDDAALAESYQNAGKAAEVDNAADWATHVEALSGIVCLYYALLRELRPATVVETGTARGVYTSLVLAALERNGYGRLISIDLPAVAGTLTMATTVPKSEVGCFIPQAYRERWTYLEGDAKVLLPRVLVEEDVDVFIHDSLHTVTHMLFEYSVARALMREGRLLMSDDILWNSAFLDFLRANRLTGYAPWTRPNSGVVVNRFDAYEQRMGLGVQAPGRDAGVANAGN